MPDPYVNLVAAVIVQAERDYAYKEDMRSEIETFLKSEGFTVICGHLGVQIKEVKTAVREGWGMDVRWRGRSN